MIFHKPHQFFLLAPLSIILLFFFVITILLNTPQIIFVSLKGNDLNSGSKENPLRTIQKAVDKAKPGTTINILPGIYRESVKITKKGTKKNSVYIKAVKKGTVVLSGSDLINKKYWKKCDNSCTKIPSTARNSIYYLKTQNEKTPSIVIEKNIAEDNKILYLARTPNFDIPKDGRVHQFWATAENTELSQTVIKDKKLLTKIDNALDATAYIMDGGSRCGGALYKQKVSRHDKPNGEIYFDAAVGYQIFGSQESGISDKSKYFLENKIEFLDSPGEWYYDEINKILYIWPYSSKSLENGGIEISYKSYGFLISNTSNLNIDGLIFKYFGANQENQDLSGAIILKANPTEEIKNILFNNLTISRSSFGIKLLAYEPNTNISSVEMRSNNLHHIQKDAITVIGSQQKPGNISGLTITESDIHHNSYLENDIGVNIILASQVDISDNFIHNNANYGIHISGPERNPGAVEDVNVSNNRIENVCQNITGCSALKFYGGKFRNTIARNNILINNIGWSYCQEVSGNKGFAHGIFISNASGISVEKNIAINNTGSAFTVYPRQIEANNNSFVGNLAAYSDFGINLSNAENVSDYLKEAETTRHDHTIIKNNILLENNTGLFIDAANPESLTVDKNAYINNKTNTTFAKKSLNWEKNSFESNLNAFKDATNGNYNIGYFSPLRKMGETIGPCIFKWIGNSCPIINLKQD